MSDTFRGAPSADVRRHIFPEHNAPAAPTPEWMRASRDSVERAHFGAVPEARQPSYEPQPRPEAPKNVRVDPLAEARAALADERRALEAEQAAVNAGREALEDERATLAEAAAEIRVARASAIDTSCDELAEIALAVVQAIITDAFEEAPERAAALARAALTPDDSATLRVGPALHIALLESGESAGAVLDATLAPYGCVAESPSRRVITGLEERLGEVLRALKEAT